MNPIDKRNILDEQVFSYRITKDKKVLIAYRAKPIKTLANDRALAFLEQVKGLSGKDEQLVLAKITGNFKRGNERSGTKKMVARFASGGIAEIKYNGRYKPHGQSTTNQAVFADDRLPRTLCAGQVLRSAIGLGNSLSQR